VKATSNTNAVVQNCCRDHDTILRENTKIYHVATHEYVRRKTFRIYTEGRCVGAHPPFWPSESATVSKQW